MKITPAQATSHHAANTAPTPLQTATQQTAKHLGQTLQTELPQAVQLATPTLTARVDVSKKFDLKQWGKDTELNYEPIEDTHFLNAFVSGGKTLSFHVQAKGDRSTLGSGKDMFIGLMKRLQEENIHLSAIETHWEVQSGSVNASTFLSNLAQGMSPEQAATNTWTGRLVGEYGFKPNSFRESGSCHYVTFKKNI
jgi:hypothetical protein